MMGLPMFKVSDLGLGLGITNRSYPPLVIEAWQVRRSVGGMRRDAKNELTTDSHQPSAREITFVLR